MSVRKRRVFPTFGITALPVVAISILLGCSDMNPVPEKEVVPLPESPEKTLENSVQASEHSGQNGSHTAHQFPSSSPEDIGMPPTEIPVLPEELKSAAVPRKGSSPQGSAPLPPPPPLPPPVRTPPSDVGVGVLRTSEWQSWKRNRMGGPEGKPLPEKGM